ncbi:hypothetical protein [Bifidobacterium saguinibicoloris]|uniref:hypothetical protein n=1 Tax=Bifidobacterium saguinibicoloris TaxID=2834433 RepID=UPI001C569A6F|nr:hypothetical protein [Bifidobacterium saguinibicoloris]MBW3081732.1 hypothetical protein [Bifidobacterium saguinibicoloris]
MSAVDIIIWTVTIGGLLLAVAAAIAGIVVAVRKPKDGDPSGVASAPVASAYIAGTIGGGPAVVWTNAKAKAVAERCGATYIGLLRGTTGMHTTIHGFGGRTTVIGGPDGLDEVAARAGVPIPREIPPFDRAYDRSIGMLMDRPLHGQHVRIYLLTYSESYEGVTRHDSLMHQDRTALVIALDGGLPGTVESTLTRVIADTGSGVLHAFYGAPASAAPAFAPVTDVASSAPAAPAGGTYGAPTGAYAGTAGSPATGAYTRFLTMLMPDSSVVAVAYDAVAALS